MKKSILLISVFMCFISAIAWSDTFGTGVNQFALDFVNISGDSGNLGNWSAGYNYSFSGVNHGDYRIGRFEVSNDQWNKFKNSLEVSVKGNPSSAYDANPYFTGTNEPTNNISWYEAAQFVNWLNTSTGHQAAYKFTGIQGTSNYTQGVWQTGDAGYNPLNPYRNSNAFYFLPTEDEWVKAAYWNGTNLQTYATVGDVAPTQNGWNFYNNGYVTNPAGPWNVGYGSVELNGTYDMMGNVWEWMESPNYTGPDSSRGIRGGSYCHNIDLIKSSIRNYDYPFDEAGLLGFRVASVPEPYTLTLLGLGGLLLRYRKNKGL